MVMNTRNELQKIEINPRGLIGRVDRLCTGPALLLLMLSLIIVGAVPQAPGIASVQDSSNKNQNAQKKDASESAKKPDAVKPNTDAPTIALGAAKRGPQKVVQEGVAVELTIDPVATGKPADLLEGEDYVVRFKIGDNRTGAPLTGLHPSGWMDLRDPGKATGGKDCRQKIQAFLQASLSARPDIDLNTYYILALNEDATVSVIDPLLGYGSSKLLTMIMLKKPGEDWVLSKDKRQLFVTMPLANEVAVVDTNTWKVIANVDVGKKPARILFQQDQKYIWVGNDAPDGGESGVTVIDPAVPRVAANIKTGAGHHEIAFNTDDRYAFVTNKQDGTLSVIDVQKLAKIKDIKIGAQPASIAFSTLSKAVYVANEGDGTIAVVGGPDQEVLSHLTAKPGLKAIRFVPGGRWGFVASRKEDAVYIFDSSTNRFVQTVEVGKDPDKISFTKTFAYIRSLGTEQVSMIQLDSIGKGGKVPVLDFPGGQIAPKESSNHAVADSIVAAPEGESVLVANPMDKTIYYYTEGMAAPMGSFQNYGHEPRAVMVWDGSLRETSPGTYSTNIKLTASGEYDVAFLLDSPRIYHCFDMTVKPNPALRKNDERVPIFVQMLIKDTQIRTGEEFKLQFKVMDTKTSEPRPGLKDVGVLVFLAPGIWQNRLWARSAADGKYEASFTPPKPGVYYVFVYCPSLGVRHNQLPYVVLEAKQEKADAPAKASK
jgi:YVTN family beta-propeller protein